VTPDPEHERATAVAWRAIARRERTAAEMRALLERRPFEPDAIDAALAVLQAAGFLDDAAYARRFAEDKRVLERWGRERIARDLSRRGIAPDLIERALAGQDRGAELGAALELLAERLPEPPASDRDRDRAWRLLVRRGYEPELAYEAVRAHARDAAA
jgi:regulatory protein